MDTMNDTDQPNDAPRSEAPRSETPPPHRRPDRLTRATDDKVVGGVAGGLGRYFGIDPIVFRIAFVVLALAGGSGVLLYLLAWVLVPDDAGGLALRRVGRERNQKLLTAVLVGGGLLLLVDQVTRRSHVDLPVGLVLVAIGALILWSRRDPDDGGLPPVTGGGGTSGQYGASYAPPAEPAATGQAEPEGPTAAEPGGGGEPPTVPFEAGEPPTVPLAMSAPPAWSPPPPPVVTRTPKAPKTPKPPKPRSALLGVTFSLLAVLAGGLALAGASAQTSLALALLLTGGALVVGAWRGRARWLIPVGLLLALALAAVSVMDVPIRGGTGGVTYRPTTLAAVSTPYRLAAGNLVVDLRGVDLGGGDLTVVASVAAGHLEVIVPDGVSVDVDAHVGAGHMNLFDRVADGFDVTRQASEPGQPGAGHLVLRTRTGFGALEVHRASA